MSYGAGAKVKQWSVRERRMGGGGGFSPSPFVAPPLLLAGVLGTVTCTFLSSLHAFSIRVEASYEDQENTYITFTQKRDSRKT